MFAKWVTEGAAFGIKAFFAIVVFAAFCAAVVGVVSIAGSIMGGKDDKDVKTEKRRPY